MIAQAIQQYLEGRSVVAGETVQAGWLILRVVSVGPPLELESLDFKAVASFTKDLREAEAIFKLQENMLRAHGVDDEPCTLMQSAVVSRSYVPGHKQAFIKRDGKARGNDSGWYVGIFDDPADMNDPQSFVVKSLYEISICDRRSAPYWLMPVGTLVSLDEGRVV